jgi:hypothetical protein
MTRTTRRKTRLLRSLVMALAAAGLLGTTLQARAHVARDRLALEMRVEAMRGAIAQAASGDSSIDGALAQWFNWGNWNNWNYWPNWGNWSNWLNHR